MTTGKTAELRLPRVFRSPWRWLGIAVGVVLVLVGISGFTVATDESGAMVIAGVFAVLGVLAIYASWRSGVLVDQEDAQQRNMIGRTERVPWADVAEVRIVPGPSVLPSRTVVLVNKSGGEDLALTSLSWYPIRSRQPRRVIQFIQTASTFIKP